jgi:hypothetical protein
MRRNDISQMYGEEFLILKAIQEIEKLPADVRLTNCVAKLSEAKNHLGDFFDNVNPEPVETTQPHPPKEETFLDRLQKERDDLHEKRTKLDAFLQNKNKAIEISGKPQYDLLVKQRKHMDNYLEILDQRLFALQID